MTRTLINLPDDDKEWLAREARSRHLPMAELVRAAVRNYRMQQENQDHPSLQATLARTRGLWRRGDGLAWQQRLRGEWDDSR